MSSPPHREGPCPRLAIAISQFNEHVTSLLLEGASGVLTASYEMSSYDIYWVPGAWELPQMLRKLSQLKDTTGTAPRYKGLLALGCLIKGDTDHYEYIAAEATRGIGEVALSAPMPVCYGLLTCRSQEQALHRARPAELNKGGEVMNALLDMVANWELIG
jgi:6,7-dimethyl-8-ribityllumazine synthase